MVTLAILIGLYSHGIFVLGTLGFLSRPIIFSYTIAILIAILLWKRKNLISLTPEQVCNLLRNVSEQFTKLLRREKLLFFFLTLFLLQVIINFIGALSPETSFDALWYHLTLPKLYLLNQHIEFIPGGLLYYSTMPKLTEMLYVTGLAFGNEITAKLIHFSFGLLTCLAIYKLSRKFFNQLISLIAVVIFYSNLVVGWESITAYIDLARTFFELMALWAFLSWYETKKDKWLITSAIMIGFAITVKILAIGSLIIFSLLILLVYRRQLTKAFKNLFTFLYTALLIPLPWLIFSYENTGNAVYPFFSNITFIKDTWILLTQSADPISPIYMILLPLILFLFVKKKIELTEIKLIAIYSFLATIIWYFTPRTGGGRFILPYLPAFSILCAAAFYQIYNNSKMYLIKKILIIIIIIVACISITYRTAANAKYFPVFTGQQTKEEYLTKNLNFSYGDFYDTDGYFKKNIKPTDKVLLFGFHNLYYVDFPFIDSSWVKNNDKFNYIAIQNGKLPKQFKNWKLTYKNEKTHVELYSLGGKWAYWKN